MRDREQAPETSRNAAACNVVEHRCACSSCHLSRPASALQVCICNPSVKSISSHGLAAVSSVTARDAVCLGDAHSARKEDWSLY